MIRKRETGSKLVHRGLIGRKCQKAKEKKKNDQDKIIKPIYFLVLLISQKEFYRKPPKTMDLNGLWIPWIMYYKMDSDINYNTYPVKHPVYYLFLKKIVR